MPPILPRWLDSTQAHDLGASLARQFMARIAKDAAVSSKRFKHDTQVTLVKLDNQIRAHCAEHRYNVFQKAKLANAFKWTLLDAGYDKAYVDELTEWLVARF
jgi:hypothetical protein